MRRHGTNTDTTTDGRAPGCDSSNRDANPASGHQQAERVDVVAPQGAAAGSVRRASDDPLVRRAMTYAESIALAERTGLASGKAERAAVDAWFSRALMESGDAE